MVLPDPDSPTTPSVSLGSMAKLTPRTASIRPASVGILIRRSVTSSSGPLAEGETAASPSARPGRASAARDLARRDSVTLSPGSCLSRHYLT